MGEVVVVVTKPKVISLASDALTLTGGSAMVENVVVLVKMGVY